MIKTLYQFGKQLQKIDSMQRYFQAFGSPYSERAENEKVIVAEIDNGQLNKLSLDEYRKTWDKKYLFRELASARSTSILPTLHFYYLPIGDKPETRASNEKLLEGSIEKFMDKLGRSLGANAKIYNSLFDSEKLLERLLIELKDFVIENCTEKKNYLFTLRIDGKWLGEIPEMVKILDDEAYNKYFSSKGQDYRAVDKTCSVTYQAVEEVWGRVDTLGFTVNDISFSRNGFDAKNSYKMFPVSPEAVKILEGTQRALEDSFSYGFQNMKFFVLPRFIALEDEELRFEVVDIYVQQSRRDKAASSETQSQSIVNSESIFNEIIHEEKLSNSSIYYDIFFYEQKQAQFSIKVHISDVLPSRFKTILNAKGLIERRYDNMTKVITKKQDVYPFYLTFYEIKKYFPEPFFFQIAEAIFYKNLVREKQVLASFMQLIVEAFKNQSEEAYKFPQLVKRSFTIYQYFQTLQLFGKMEVQEKESISLNAEIFVEQHQNFFQGTPLKMAAFYLGCATEILLNAQDSHLGSRPFNHKLNNLSIGYREMMEIKPKLLAKTDEYQKADKLYGGYEDFLRLIARFDASFVEANERQADKTEISYAFSLGLTIQREFFLNRIKERSKAKKDREAHKQNSDVQN
ncbi:hypothetical protein GCM10027275_48140 [Rhabdobacter roseus]|nr:TM1802 family CRISPR-associated protein [Rhabdobacter roseus]